jgi:hypothetical protein
MYDWYFLFQSGPFRSRCFRRILADTMCILVRITPSLPSLREGRLNVASDLQKIVKVEPGSTYSPVLGRGFYSAVKLKLSFSPGCLSVLISMSSTVQMRAGWLHALYVCVIPTL